MEIAASLSVEGAVGSEQGSNQKHITLSNIHFSSSYVSVYGAQTLFFVNVEMEPGTSHHG